MDPAASPAPPPCSAWSLLASDLAVDLEREVAQWPETPVTRRLVAEGALVPVGPGRFAPADLVQRAADRALLVGCAVGRGLRSHHVIAGRSAHWVHTGAIFPDPLELITEAHRSVLPGTRVRHARLDPGDVEQISGVPVTTPQRAAADLLRFEAEHGLHAAESLVRTGLCTPAQIRRVLASARGFAGSRRALELLTMIAARCEAPAEGADTRERAVTRVREAGRWARSESVSAPAPAPAPALAPAPVGSPRADARAAPAHAFAAPVPSTTLPSAVTR